MKILKRGDKGSIEQNEFIYVLIVSLHALDGGTRRQAVIEYVHQNSEVNSKMPITNC